ncbi:hypothetical protein F5B17DRAFT_428259 [Nemania serpens]|nr:hypothetical protein F5B17DRAFT_428259 [Nemania serpens]
MSSETPDHYATLEVGWGASDRELRDAYRRLIRIHHPDKNKGNEKAATAKFQEIHEAFEILGNPEKRRTYNQNHSWKHSLSCPPTTVPESQRWNAYGYGQRNTTTPTTTTATATPAYFENTEQNSYHAWYGNHWGPSCARTWAEVEHEFSEMLRRRQEQQGWGASSGAWARERFGARAWRPHSFDTRPVSYDARSTWIPAQHYPPPLMQPQPRAYHYQRDHFWSQRETTHIPAYLDRRQPLPWVVASCWGYNRCVEPMAAFCWW